MPVLALNLHAGFACRHSGACYMAGWPIPVDTAAADAIRAHAIATGPALFTPGELPEGAAAVLVPLPGGACPALDHAARVMAAATCDGRPASRWGMPLTHAQRLYSGAAASVPQDLKRPDAPVGLAEADLAWVSPRWAAHARPVRRYLAARAFAAWSAYLGEGLRTQVAMLAVALAVVRIEAAREAMLASRPLDDALLHSAIRSADLLLCHLSDTAVLVRSLGVVEREPTQALLDAFGLEAAG